ncbi:MAG TPA: T9SS type A sorting domain-containing protein [Bacteroidia bacterium]|nr:T9SS type A sorting domain-containing protein [Bacteroidia bacterium]
MKKLIINVTIVALLMAVTNSFAQMIYWTTPPYRINTSTSIPTSSALPGGGGAYSVANGAYDPSGNLLFFVRDYGIYGPTGSNVGTLAPYNSQVCAEEYSILCSEVAIVPIPGTCNQFYVIYSMDNPVGYSPVLYVKVDCSGATPVVTYNGSVYVNCPPIFVGYKNQAFWVSGHGGADHTAIAVSKVYTGSGSTAKRFLFSVSNNGIVRSDITNTGISAGTTVATYATLGLPAVDAFECEVSWGTNLLAWSNINGTVHVIGIVSTTGAYQPSTLQNYNVTAARGIEFTNATTNPKLYVSGSGGLTQILTATQVQSSILTPGYNFTNTYLEYGKNNRVYGISPTFSGPTLTATTFPGINTSSNTISAYNPGFVDSRFTYGYLGQYTCFTLPNQIDGESYAVFSGLPNVTIANFTLNGSSASGNCETTSMPVYYNCNPLVFNATYNNGTPTQYKFDIQAIDGGCQLTTGGVNYHGLWTAGQPTANLNLFTLTGTFTGTVQVKFSIQDACGNVSTQIKNINILGPPPAANSVFKLYNGNGGSAFANGTTCTAPYALCQTSDGGIYANFSTGTVCYYNVKLEKLTGACPNGFTNLGTTPNYNVSACNPVNITPKTMNAIGSDMGLGLGYFDIAGNLNTTYRITLTVGNACSSNSAIGYFNPSNASCRMANPNSNTESQNNVSGISVYPNPASDNVTVEFSASADDYYEIEITDMLGKQVMLLMPLTKISKGVFKKSFDISKLNNGIYTYRIKSSTVNQSGRILKN